MTFWTQWTQRVSCLKGCISSGRNLDSAKHSRPSKTIFKLINKSDKDVCNHAHKWANHPIPYLLKYNCILANNMQISIPSPHCSVFVKRYAGEIRCWKHCFCEIDPLKHVKLSVKKLRSWALLCQQRGGGPVQRSRLPAIFTSELNYTFPGFRWMNTFPQWHWARRGMHLEYVNFFNDLSLFLMS